jgi:hypothetical protein
MALDRSLADRQVGRDILARSPFENQVHDLSLPWRQRSEMRGGCGFPGEDLVIIM